MDIDALLKALVDNDGSDLYLTVGAPPAAKFQGTLKAVAKETITRQGIKDVAYKIMDSEQIKQFEKKPEMNLAISKEGIGRFRVNIFKQRSSVAMVIRNIKVDIPNANALGLPAILKESIMEKRGLILFIGGTGSGKSTSLAALIDHRNSNSNGHIITIEDPIEYIHPHKKCLISQREVGVDTDSFEDALENTLRQAPDVILIGEIRTQETMEHALAFAETGHLCLSTLHANNSNQALDRIINFFPEERRHQLLLDLSLNLKAFISQRLIPTVDGKRTAAIEILLGTPRICDLIKKGEVAAIKEVMSKSAEQGMQTFDNHLYQLYKEGTISLEEALKNADSPSNIQVRLNVEKNPLNNNDSDGSENNNSRSELDHMELEPIQQPEENVEDDDSQDVNHYGEHILLRPGTSG